MYGVQCWNAIKDTHLSWPTFPSWKTVLLIMDLLHNFIDIKATDFNHVLLQLVEILNTLFTNYWVSYRQLTFITERFELLVKSYAKFDLLFVNILCITARSLEKMNFLRLKWYISWTISVVSIKFAWYVAWILTYKFFKFGPNLCYLYWNFTRIFSSKWFFIGTPCTYHCAQLLYTKW